MVPGEGDGTKVIFAAIDEVDEGLALSKTSFFLSEGVAGVAPESVAGPVRQVTRFLDGQLRKGGLTEADFGRKPGQVGGPARLTPQGEAKARRLLGLPDAGPGDDPGAQAVKLLRP